MKKIFATVVVLVTMAFGGWTPEAQAFDWSRILAGGFKALQAATITDSQLAAYVQQSVQQMDAKAQIAPPDSPYTKRLQRLTSNLHEAGGMPLNFKVYMTNQMNAFACPDGSVRVYSGLMDKLTDDELLGVIGHEIGHVALHHSKKALKEQLLTGALKDVLASTNGTVAALTDSQLGAIGQSLINSHYSQKQEMQADNAGYDFLKANGKNPLGMATAFEKLEQYSGSGSGNFITQAFSDHPDTQKRIANILKRAKKDGYSVNE